MYRKQVRRRRAVLALLIVGSFVLLTITYSQGSNGLQRGVSTIFSPIQDVADRALKPARDLVDWFDQTFDARGENSRLEAELAKAREQAVAGQEALARKRAAAQAARPRPRPVRPLGLRAGDRQGDRALADGLALERDDRRRQLRRRRVDDPVISGDGLVGPSPPSTAAPPR